MRKQNPIDIVMTLWEQINTSPWITLEGTYQRCEYKIHFEMRHSKTLARQTFQLEPPCIHRLDDPWTQKYVLEQLGSALAALTHNTVEAGVGSIDVYREDWPA
jgi:hypothetical protein